MLDPILIAKGLAGIPAMYGLFSFNEYMTHKYYQHNEIGKVEMYQNLRAKNLAPKLDGGGHVEHHAETYDDMMLKTDDENWMKSAPAQRLNGDVFRGTAFSWSVTAMMMTQCIPTVYPVFLFLLGWSPLATTAFFVPALLFHGLLWNALHPAMHGLPDVPSSYGLPSWVLRPWRESKLFDMLRENHAGHHVMSGRANYNVCCPGFDHILGTFTPEAEWRPQVRANTARPIEGALMASEM